MSLRRAVVSVLSVIGLVLSSGGPAAQASSGSLFVCTAYYNCPAGSPQDNVGLLSVTIASSTPLTSLTVSLYDSSNTDRLDLPLGDFVVPAGDGSGNWERWTLQNPITTGQLALGQYSVEVTAADSGGDQVSDALAGTLYFENEVLFSNVTSNGTTFDYDNQDVTFSGTTTLLAPGGTPQPFANQALGLQGTFGPPVPVTTDSSGAFTVTVPAQNELYWMEYPGDAADEIGFSATPPISITVNSDPVQIKAALANSNPNQGQADSVTGTLTYTGASGTKPLVGVTVSLYEGWSPRDDPGPTASAVTNASGQFSLPVPTAGYGYWSVATTSTQFLQGAQDNLHFTVAQPNAILSFRATLNAFAVVSVHGCIVGASAPVRIEYATAPAGPWKVLGKVNGVYGSSCSQGGVHGGVFAGHLRAQLARAYYRAQYVRTADWQGAVSKPVFLSRLLTKITNFSVSPRTVAQNGDVTVAGRLWAANQAGSKWHAYGHRNVIVVFRYQGKWYRYRYSPETTSAGWFRHSFKVYAGSPFFAQYNGDATHFACASVRITVSTSAALPGFLAWGQATTVAMRRVLPAGLVLPATG